MMRPRPTAAKPFFWVQLKGSPERRQPPRHDRFEGNTGRLELLLQVVSDYLYVGSGQIELRTVAGRQQPCYAFARRDGQLVVPGTSVKGAVRAVVEAISNSCVKQRTRSEQVPGQHRPCDEAGPLCPACRLFGTTGYRGRVHFSDAVPASQVGTEVIKIADLWPPRGTRGRKFYSSGSFRRLDLTPAKNYRFIEAVPKGSAFTLALHFENVQSAELGLLVRALGLECSPHEPSRLVHAFPTKLGGAKPRCLGAVRFTPRNLVLIGSGRGLLADLMGGGRSPAIEETLTSWLADASLLDGEAWNRFRREASQARELCPPELY